jgi:uncharacterized lipoprotein YmbA
LATGAAVLSTTACLGSPQVDASAFFLLSPPPADAPGTDVPVSIGIGPVWLPGYLDRPQIVTRLSDNEIALAEADRWAEPLADNLVRTLEETLAGLLPGSTYVDFPWYPAGAPDYALALEVRRFEADAEGAVMLDATWTLSRAAARVDRRAVRMVVQAEAPDRASSIAAHSRALAAVCEEIAATLRRAAGR